MIWPARTATTFTHLGAVALLLMVLSVPAKADEGCKLGLVAALPITMAGTRPMITAKINDKEARFVLDSGAFFSLMSTATAAEFDLKLKAAPYGFTLQGIGGAVSPQIAVVKEFAIAGAIIHNVEFLAGGSEVGGAGLIGQNFLEQWDVEYDFSKGVVRLFKPQGCKKNLMAYWITPGQTYSLMDIESVAQARMHTSERVTSMAKRFT